MESSVIVILMAGGRGERFWPYSRISKPKQTLKIDSNRPMLIESIERLLPLVPEENIYINTGKHLENDFRNILTNYKVQWIIEPLQRDTAAAIGFALSFLIYKIKKDFIAIILGVDYRIPEAALFRKHLIQAIDLAEQNYIVTLGIKPTRPATGYGYIKKSKKFSSNLIPAFEVESFKEKPDHDTALVYLSNHNYLWNSGMFITSAVLMLSEISKFIPEQYNGLIKMQQNQFEKSICKKIFEGFSKISIDYAVMEKTSKLLVLESSFEWDDLGDWKAYDRLIQPDENGNVVDAQWAGINTNNCLIIDKTEEKRGLIATMGISDLLIINSGDALLICQKDQILNIKALIQEISFHEEFKEFL